MRLLTSLKVVLLALGIALVVQHLQRPDFLLVGNVTIDLVDGKRPTGGAVSYAAVAVKALGMSACIVTVAGPDADLSVFGGQELHVVQAPSTLTFEHTYTWFGHQRRLRVTANPNITLTRDHVPRHCLRARAVLLGPLTLHDVDAASFASFDGTADRLLRSRQRLALAGQGMQRQMVGGGATGKVAALDQPSKQLMAGLGRTVSVFLSDVETEGWGDHHMAAVSQASQRFVVTQGGRGAQEWNASGTHAITAVPVGYVVDTNGAGDTFATGYMAALIRGDPDPGLAASWAASRTVMQPQACKPHCAGARIVGTVPTWGWLQRLAVDVREMGLGLVEAALDLPAHQLGCAADALVAIQQALPSSRQEALDATRRHLTVTLPQLYQRAAAEGPQLAATAAHAAATAGARAVASALQALHELAAEAAEEQQWLAPLAARTSAAAAGAKAVAAAAEQAPDIHALAAALLKRPYATAAAAPAVPSGSGMGLGVIGKVAAAAAAAPADTASVDLAGGSAPAPDASINGNGNNGGSTSSDGSGAEGGQSEIHDTNVLLATLQRLRCWGRQLLALQPSIQLNHCSSIGKGPAVAAGG